MIRTLLVLLGFAACFLAPTPARASTTDVSAVPDFELGPVAARARTDAAALDATAAEKARQHTEAIAAQDAAQAEIERIRTELPPMGRVQRGLAESRIKELEEAMVARVKRIGDLAGEVQRGRTEAGKRRTLAGAAEAAAVARRAEAKDALPEDADLSTLSDARLTAARAYFERRGARAPLQLAALDARITRDADPEVRAAAIAGKETVRQGLAAERAMIVRIDDERRFRVDSLLEEKEQARILLETGKLRAEEEVEREAVLTTAESARIDRVLDRIIAQEDAVAARSVENARLFRNAARIGAVVVVFGGGAALVWWIVGRR